MQRPSRSFFVLVAILTLLAPAVAAAQSANLRDSKESASESTVSADLDEGNGAAKPQLGIPDRNLLEIIRSGGVMMYPIAISSFLLLIFVFERFISLRRGHVIPRPFVKRFLHQ